MFDQSAFQNHEALHFFHDEDTGLRALIAVHSTALGPSAGGCRLWNYKSEQEMIRDGLRLSYGMSLKNSVAGLDLGGGKAVIWAEHSQKSTALFEAFGRFVDSLNGTYITAEDVGISVDDMEIVGTQTRHVAGTRSGPAAGSDPSPHTARGIYLGLKAACARVYGTDDVSNIHIAVQGVGSVGGNVARLLAKDGAKLTITDINTNVAQDLAREIGASFVKPEDIYDVAADVFSPNALGAIINSETLPRLKVKIIAGGANNQLATATQSLELAARNILYVPDFVINGGGIINVASEVSGMYSLDWVNAKIDTMIKTLGDILDEAVSKNQATEPIAIARALQRIKSQKTTSRDL